jgi:hypothetical protein
MVTNITLDTHKFNKVLGLLASTSTTDAVETGFVSTSVGVHQLANCKNSHCVLYDSQGNLVYKGTPEFIAHSHVIGNTGDQRQDLETSFMRTLAGPEEHSPLAVAGVPSYFKGTDGVVRVVERLNGNYRIRTVTPGASDLSNQSLWQPGRSGHPGMTKTQQRAVNRYKAGKLGFKKALKEGGVKL